MAGSVELLPGAKLKSVREIHGGTVRLQPCEKQSRGTTFFLSRLTHFVEHNEFRLCVGRHLASTIIQHVEHSNDGVSGQPLLCIFAMSRVSTSQSHRSRWVSGVVSCWLRIRAWKSTQRSTFCILFRLSHLYCLHFPMTMQYNSQRRNRCKKKRLVPCRVFGVPIPTKPAEPRSRVYIGDSAVSRKR